MGFNEEEKHATPPPVGWAAAQKKPGTRKIDAMSRRRHAIRQDAGRRLTDQQREILGTAWNQYMNRCARTSPQHFARVHGREFLSQTRLEDWINSIHRESLNGETAYAYDSRLAKVA